MFVAVSATSTERKLRFSTRRKRRVVRAASFVLVKAVINGRSRYNYRLGGDRRKDLQSREGCEACRTGSLAAAKVARARRWLFAIRSRENSSARRRSHALVSRYRQDIDFNATGCEHRRAKRNEK